MCAATLSITRYRQTLDYQGAVVVPADCLKDLADAVALVLRREKVILDACREPAFNSRN